MYWFMREAFKIAYEKASEVLDRIRYTCDDLVSTTKIMDAVEAVTGYDVKYDIIDFSKLVKGAESDAFAKCGAAMYVPNDEKKARIILNSKENAKMQRFSLVHELGHLTMLDHMSNGKGYKFSTHINMDITSIPEALCKENEILKREQMANIFALLVLIPDAALIEALKKYDSIDDISKIFGVEKNAVISRLKLGIKAED